MPWEYRPVSAHPLQRLLAPRTLAIIGASERHDSLGTAFTRQALDSEFEGTIHLVNRNHDSVFGRTCLRDTSELPIGIDLALVLTPWASVPEIIDQLAQRGCGGAVVVGIANDAGWPWASNRNLLKRLQRQVAQSGLRIIGPASQGLSLSRAKLNLSLCPALPPPGGIGFVSSSGAVAGVIADWATQRGVGMSALLSLGDQVDISIADCLDWFAADSGTRAVLVHVETLANARRFLSAARTLAFRKPLVILKPNAAGRLPSDPESLLSDRVHAAAFARAGMLQARDLEELCAATNVDLPAWPHAGSRFAIAGNGRALGALAADAVADCGGELTVVSPETVRRIRAQLPPRASLSNPLDLQRDAGPERYAAVTAALAADPGTDVVLLLHHPTTFSSGQEIAQALPAVAQGEALVLAAFAGAEQQGARRILAERGIAAFATPEAAVRAYGLNRRYFRQKAELAQTPPPLLRWPNLPMDALEELAAQVTEMPVRLLGQALLGRLGVDIRIDTENLEREPRIGFRTHPLLGPYAIAQAHGAEHIELLPLDRLRVARLIERGWAATPRIGAGQRSLLGVHLLEIAALVEHFAQITRLELEGVGQDETGGLHAQLRFEWSPGATRPKTAFAPYPWDIAEPVILADGQRCLLRAIRAEDEPQLQIGFTQLSAEEVRMRFLYPLKSLTHDLAARLTQLDYDRELALVLADLEPPGQSRLMGVVRASYDPAENASEFAIVIPRQLAGQGLGTRLLGRIIELTRLAKVPRIYGDTLPENAAMRALARKLGFTEELRDHLIRLNLPL